MRRLRRQAHRVGTVAVAVALAAALASIAAPSVAAECDGGVPSFREHAAKAKRVVIGDVVDVDLTATRTDEEGRSSHFLLKVKYVLRGASESTMSLRDIEYIPCTDHLIVAHRGDRIALALDVPTLDPTITINPVAWIDGTEPRISGVERTTVRDAFLVLGLEPPAEEVPLQPADDPIPPWAIAAVVIAIVVALVVFWRRYPTRSPQ